MNKKKFKYIKIRDEKEPSARKTDFSVPKFTLAAVRKTLGIIGTTFAVMILIIVIALCIVATVVTVYVMQFNDENYDVNIKDADVQLTSFIYAFDSEGKEVEVKRLTGEENRIWADISEIPQYMRDALVAVEDKRFYEHEGVDWYRIIGVVMSRSGEGGSTITMQLVRNVTGDNEITEERKLREIFRALKLNQKYSRDDILEAYLNKIWFGGGTIYGIGAASGYYFDKTPSELTLAESAILAGIIRNPAKTNPYANLERCKKQQLYALLSMYEQGLITAKEYEEAKSEKVRFKYAVEGDAFGYVDERYGAETEEEEEDDTSTGEYEAYKFTDYEPSQNWYVDAAIDRVITDYAELKGVSYSNARTSIYSGGFNIYLNMDMELQAKVEELYKNPYLIQSYYDPSAPMEDQLQSAFVLMDYNGDVLALAGGVGDKEGDNIFNRATQATRAPGSTIKPLSVYGPAIDENLITYSTMIPDKGIELPGETGLWPYNYGKEGGDGTLMGVYDAVKYSRNTIAVRTLQLLTTQKAYDHLKYKLGFTTLTEEDSYSLSALALGGLTKGVYLYELAAAYQTMGNGGVYYEPSLYSKVTDSKGKVILEKDNVGINALSSEAAWITNRLMYNVVNGYSGTGTYARLGNVEVVGKTGTSNDEANLLFAGLTPEYVGTVWLGYDDNREFSLYSTNAKAAAQIWHDIMIELVDTTQVQKFMPDPNVIELMFDAKTGLPATSKTKDKLTGYYKRDNLPEEEID